MHQYTQFHKISQFNVNIAATVRNNTEIDIRLTGKKTFQFVSTNFMQLFMRSKIMLQNMY